MKQIMTAGYGNLAPDDFVKLLKDAGITLVVDVRRENTKGRLRAYDAGLGNGMEALMNAAGIAYHDHPSLAKKESDTLDEYKAWLDTRDGGLTSSGLYATIEVLWPDEVVCLVCAEGNPFETDGVTPRCHRAHLLKSLLYDFDGEREGKHLLPTERTQ